MQARVPRIALALIAGTIAVAMGTRVPAQAPKELAGTWKLNAAKSKFSPGPAPKSMTVTYIPSSDDGVKIVVDLTPADGPVQHWEMSGHYDGKESPVTGNPNADTVSLKRIDSHSGESTFKKGGKVVATNTRVLSKDGKTLTVTSKGLTADGKPRLDVQVFEK